MMPPREGVGPRGAESAPAQLPPVWRSGLRYSIFTVLGQAMSGQKGWTPAWREPSPKATYDVVIVGGGGHGLATAYYLAKEHGLNNVAVVEKLSLIHI